ncbi:MAG: NINE protein [Alistipes sp.]|nr:NINE protein [Alistipes sp.]
MAQQEMKCPTCGGDKFRHKEGSTYRCAYCGGTVIGPEIRRAPAASATQEQTATRRSNKDKTTALILCLFLGGIGVHKFYLGQTAWGILYILFCWTQITFLIAFIEFIVLAATSSEEFDRKYNF